MQHRFSRSRYRAHGLTVVELLIVIVIIGILAGLLLPAINAARKRGQITAINLEIQNLKNAVEQYKQTYGDYPPDGTNIVVLERHLRTAFPRIHQTEITKLSNLIVVESNPCTLLDPAEALVFFLGGFSEDPRYPFSGDGGPFTGDRKNAIFDFNPERLFLDDENSFGKTNDGFPVYLPEQCDLPYVYFDSRTYLPRPSYRYSNLPVRPAQYPSLLVLPKISQGDDGYAYDSSNVPANPNLLRFGVARPYRSMQVKSASFEDAYQAKWTNPDSFQIISAGLTNHYGDYFLQSFSLTGPDNNRWLTSPHKHFPGGDNYSDGDLSNITNFSRGQLEDELP